MTDEQKTLSLPFDWRASPRIDHGIVRTHPIMPPVSLEFLLPSERRIKLNQLHQYYVYEGKLAGLPGDPEANFLSAINSAEGYFPNYGATPLILEPEFHFGKKPMAMRDEGEVYANWLKLPDICTIAEFTSDSPARDRAKYRSHLVVIWFQDQYGLPCSEYITTQLQTLDWKSYAVDGGGW